MDEIDKQMLIVMAMYWVFNMLMQQVLNIQALVLGFEMERSALLVNHV
jgi:hypothetical protein